MRTLEVRRRNDWVFAWQFNFRDEVDGRRYTTALTWHYNVECKDGKRRGFWWSAIRDCPVPIENVREIFRKPHVRI